MLFEIIFEAVAHFVSFTCQLLSEGERSSRYFRTQHNSDDGKQRDTTWERLCLTFFSFSRLIIRLLEFIYQKWIIQRSEVVVISRTADRPQCKRNLKVMRVAGVRKIEENCSFDILS